MASQRRRVLVVEDDAATREPLADLLRLEGYTVTTAPDGASAIRRLISEGHDAVVLDLGLPDVLGTDVIRAACALPNGRPAVIVFTGYHRLRPDAEAAGCDAFVLKPELEELLAQLSRIMEARQPGRKQA